jgi:hypothetical protein
MDEYEGAQINSASLHKYLYANASPLAFFDPSGTVSMTEIQQAGFVIVTLARIAAPNIARFGIKLIHQVAAQMLRPFFVTVGSIPLVTQMGQRLSPWDKFQRLFITPTVSYPGVANWVKDLFQIAGIRAQQGHIFIQQSWYRVGSPNQWYPNDPMAHQGLQRLGNAGFNLMAIPEALNRTLGAQSVAGSTGTAAFATATASGLVFAMDYIWDLVMGNIEDPAPTQTVQP